MAKKIDLDTIAKEYAEGRISREDFLYLHKMLTDPANNPAPQNRAAKPARTAPPVLNTSRPLKAGTAQQRQAAQHQAAQQQRRSIRPDSAPASTPRTHNTHEQASSFPDLSIPDLSADSSPPKTSVFGYFRNHHKEAVALLGTLGIFISMFYNKFDTPTVDSGNARVVMVQERGNSDSKSGEQAPRLRTQDIKLIAQIMMEDNSWNKELIDDFIVQWNRLSISEKESIKQTDWYSLFSTLLAQQIKTARIKAKTGDVTSIYNQQALLGLADSLVFGDNKVAKSKLAELASSNSKDYESGKLSKQQAQRDKSESKTSKIKEAKLSNKSKPEHQSTSKRHRISRKEIEAVMNRFTVAFEAGQMQDLGDLFADDDYSTSFASLDKIKKEYRKIFRTTNNRQIEFGTLFWEHDYDEARGSAKYTANIRMTGDGTKKTITANLDITLRRLLGKVYITDFRLSDRDVVTHSPKSKKVEVAKKLNNKPKPKHPTPAELQDLVTQYMTAYETGDTDELMHLFANATWTKSRTGLVEMKQNYDNLFTTTSGREIFVKNMNWTFKGKKALGTGDLTLTLHTSDNKVKSQKGKIRIVATKVGDSVRISQMFHIVD